MRIEQIVALLIQERDRIETAIQALDGVPKRGRPADNSHGSSEMSRGEPKKGATFRPPLEKRWRMRRRDVGQR